MSNERDEDFPGNIDAIVDILVIFNECSEDLKCID
jgi:hypothetical protein